MCLPLLRHVTIQGVGFTSYTAVMGHMGGDAAAAHSVSAVVRDPDVLCNGLPAVSWFGTSWVEI